MKQLVFLLSLSVAAWAAAGCSAPRHLPARTAERDSVAVTYKDSTVIRYIDIEVPVPVERSHAVVPDSSHLETSVAVSDASIDSLGRLHHNLENKPVKLPAKVSQKEEFHEHTLSQQKVETITVTKYVEKELTPWQTFRLKAFWPLAGIILAALVLLVARIAFKIR